MKRRTEEDAPRAFNRAPTTLVDSPVYTHNVIVKRVVPWGCFGRFGDRVSRATDDWTRDISGPMAAVPINAMYEQLPMIGGSK